VTGDISLTLLPGHLREALLQPVAWGAVTSRFCLDQPQHELVSNIHVVPFVGSNCVFCDTAQSGLEMPGGTIEPGESMISALARELREEIGATLLRSKVFAYWDCRSSADKPYRPYIPHPLFHVAIGWAEVTIVGPPERQDGVNAEDIIEVMVIPVEEAISRFEAAGKCAVAAIYKLAAQNRSIG
jgi:8-oxo-dGTP diphosphatase